MSKKEQDTAVAQANWAMQRALDWAETQTGWLESYSFTEAHLLSSMANLIWSAYVHAEQRKRCCGCSCKRVQPEA